jgi:dipeptidyl aminopeptidase/acylaminoacyl peptidase
MHRCLLVGLLALGSVAVAADPRPMTVDDLWNVKRLGPPSISPDGRWCVVEVTTFDTEKDDSTSDLWLLSTDGKEQKPLTHAGKNSGPKWSPDGKLIAFTSKRGTDEFPQVYVISPAGGEARKLSDLPTAASGLKWAADSKRVFCIGWTWPDSPDDADHKKREKQLKDGKRKGVVIDDAVYRYWDKWLYDGKRPTVYAIDAATGKHTNLLLGTGKHLPPTQPSENDYDVSPDGSELCFVAETAKDPGTDFNSDLYTITLGGKGEGVIKNITTDNPASDTNPVYSPDGKSIAFLRQTTKFFYADRQRLMVIENGSKPRELTEDLDRSAQNPKWEPKGDGIAFEAEDAGYVRVFFESVDKALRVSHTTDFSSRSIDFDKVGDRSVSVRNSFNEPPTVNAHGPLTNKPIKIAFFNDEITKQWKLGKVELTKILGSGDALVPMWVFYPPDFDPKKKWPLVQMIHGGPHNGIMSEFSFRWNPHLWAARGYVVAVVNFHGSSGFGQKYADSITGDYATKPMTDILKATEWFEPQPWIDKTRMAAAGGSYGGYMVAYLNGHTDKFKAYVCHAGVYTYHGQMASDVVKGRERSLGAFPWADLEKVDQQTAQRFAKNFKTPTIVLHGEKDYRVPITQGLEHYNTLRQKGVPTRLVYFPDENHWILKPQNSKLWHKEVFAWLDRYIGTGPTK